MNHRQATEIAALAAVAAIGWLLFAGDVLGPFDRQLVFLALCAITTYLLVVAAILYTCRRL